MLQKDFKRETKNRDYNKDKTEVFKDHERRLDTVATTTKQKIEQWNNKENSIIIWW